MMSLKLVPIKNRQELVIDTHVTNICNGVSKILNALVRISQFTSIHKRTMIMKALLPPSLITANRYG